MDPRSPEQNAYRSALARCQNPNHPDYPNYGERGIEFRFSSFEQFLAEVGPRPSRKHSLDRFPNNTGHYETGNVRWATMSEQGNNRRTNRFLTFAGQVKTIREWAVALGVSATAILYKRKLRGWCDNCTISAPRGGKCLHRISHFQPKLPLTS